MVQVRTQAVGWTRGLSISSSGGCRLSPLTRRCTRARRPRSALRPQGVVSASSARRQRVRWCVRQGMSEQRHRYLLSVLDRLDGLERADGLSVTRLLQLSAPVPAPAAAASTGSGSSGIAVAAIAEAAAARTGSGAASVAPAGCGVSPPPAGSSARGTALTPKAAGGWHEITVRIVSNWGSATHVGLNEIEVLDADGTKVALANSQALRLPTALVRAGCARFACTRVRLCGPGVVAAAATAACGRWGRRGWGRQRIAVCWTRWAPTG